MLGSHKIRSEAESQGVRIENLAVENAQTIENLLRRAHEIHREHGGFVGYDLEDWLQAEQELAEDHSATFLPVEMEIRGLKEIRK